MEYSAKLAVDGFTFPESPRWHAGRQAFYHVDIDEGELFELKDGVSRKLHKFEGVISGITFDDEDGFFVASVFGKKIVHLEKALGGDGVSSNFADLSSRVLGGVNDMVRSVEGNLYAGGFNFNAIAKFEDDSIPTAPGTFVKIDRAGNVSDNIGDTLFPNGSVVTPDGKRLLLADSYQNCIHSWVVAADGSLSNQSVWAQLSDEEPDGMCLDEEGALWIASHQRVLRVREGGEILDEIHLNDGHVTACALGGADGRTLLVTAAASVDRRIVRASRTGKIYLAQVEVPGAGRPSVYA